MIRSNIVDQSLLITFIGEFSFIKTIPHYIQTRNKQRHMNKTNIYTGISESTPRLSRKLSQRMIDVHQVNWEDPPFLCSESRYQLEIIIIEHRQMPPQSRTKIKWTIFKTRHMGGQSIRYQIVVFIVNSNTKILVASLISLTSFKHH